MLSLRDASVLGCVFFQMLYPQMMPYYSMPMYSPYMGSLLMRTPGGAGMRFGHHRSLPRPGLHHPAAAAAAAAHRAEGVRMLDVSHTLRSSPQRLPHRGRLPMYQIPRVPVHYPYTFPHMHPMYAQHPHPSHAGYYMMPEELRMPPVQTPFPYSAPYPLQPHLPPQLRGPITGPHSHLHGTHLHQGSPLHTHALAGHPAASASPQGRPAPGDEGQDSTSSPESGRSDNLAGASMPGQGFQVLPNVKHVPAHLMRPSLQPSSQSSSRSSTPINTLDRVPNPVPPHLQEGRGTPVSDRPYSPANYAARSSPLSMTEEACRDRSGSRERDLATKEADLVGQFASLQTAGNGAGGGDLGHKKDSLAAPIPKKTNNPKQLRLKTGFSRQFSDDLPTPTAITDIVRMIEENIEEVPEASDSSASSPATPQRAQLLSRLNGRNAALSSLQLDLVAAQQRQHQHSAAGSSTSHSTPSSDSPATLNGERPTYAGIVGKPTAPGQGFMQDFSQMEPQTPRTPLGFITPGGEVDVVDPFGILKSLNIEAGTAEQRQAQEGGSLPWERGVMMVVQRFLFCFGAT